MRTEILQMLSSAIVALGIVLTALGGFGQHYFGKQVEREREAAQKELQQKAEAQKASEAAVQAEQLRRHHVLAQLRQLYIVSHDGLSAEILAGTAPLPKDWTEQKLKELGEMWSLDSY